MNDYEIACGSVVGKDHISSGKVLIGRNNQDAYAIRQDDNTIVALVCDGCGSGKHSEVGAWIGANSLAESLIRRFRDDHLSASINPLYRLESARSGFVAQLQSVAPLLGGSVSRVVNDYLLFTVVGVIITKQRMIVFSLGDGAYALKYVASGTMPENIGFREIGPFPDNSPPYIAYDLVESSIDPELFRFKILAVADWNTFESVLIGSDGLTDFVEVEHSLIPGTKEEVGSLGQFWTDPYFSNPDAVNRKLKRMNAEVVRVNKETGRKITYPRLLPDDTTLIAIRRKVPWIPDRTMEKACMDAYDAGDRSTLQEAIDERRAQNEARIRGRNEAHPK